MQLRRHWFQERREDEWEYHDRNHAIELMKQQHFAEARLVLEELIQETPDDGNLEYMVGQCCRFDGDLTSAVFHLQKAAELALDQKEVFLALGIALQLTGQYEPAKLAFARCLEMDPDYVEAINSLALTQKKMGEHDKVTHNLDLGLKCLTRKIVNGLVNHRDSPIFKTRLTGAELWVESAMFGALYLCSISEGIDTLAWPTAAQAEEEEQTEQHGGLYWVDRKSQDGKTARCLLPNYFNTFRETLKRDPLYASLIGNKGTVLELMGDDEEAAKCFAESEAFSTSYM